MDDARRANAAQMATRTIKAAKGRRKAPIQSNPGTPQSMSFGGGGGGLFGGSVQAAGTFDFSAPGGGLSFPPSPFGGNNAFGNSAASENGDSPADTTGDEDARRKRPFQGFPNPASSAPVQSNPFGQNQQSNPFSSITGQAQQANNPFNFQSASQPASPGLGGFNSAPQDKPPASSIFNFGSTPSQPASPAPSIIFGSGPSQEPASTSFSFSQAPTQSAKPGSPIFNFGSPAASAAQDKPTNTPFTFPQTSTQPSSPGLFGSAPVSQAPTSNLFSNSQPASSGITFGSAPATEKPVTNMFGTSQLPQPAPSTTLFGSAPKQSAPPTNIFSYLNTPASPSSNLFNNQQEPKAAATPSALFGGQSQPSTTSSLFGNLSQPSAKSSPFGEQKSATPSTNSLFSNLNKPAESAAPSTNTLFSNLNKPAEPTSNLFGSPKSAPTTNLFGGPPAPTSDLFGNLNKPVDQPASQSEVNDTPVNGISSDAKASESLTPPLFNKTTSTNSFGSSSLFSAPNSQAETINGGSKPTLSFGSSQSSAPTAHANGNSAPTISFGSSQPSVPTSQTNGKAPFSPMKPIDAPSSASRPPPSGMFPNLPPPSPTQSSDASNNSAASTALTKGPAEPSSSSNALVNGNTTKHVDYDSLYAEMATASSITDEQMSPLVPARFSESQKNEFYTAYRLRSLNKAIEKFFGSVTFGTGISNLIAYYNDKKVEILNRSSLPIPGSKRRSTDDEDQENENPNKRSRHDAPPKSNLFQPQSATPTSKRNKLDDNENQENENPSKQSRQDAPSKSNIFQSQTQTQTARSPEKSRSENQPQPYLNGGSTPKAPTFVPPPSFVPPMPSSSTAPLGSPSTKGKRKAEVQLTKDDDEREEHEGRRMKTPKFNDNFGGSSTSNIFKSIVDSPTKANQKKVAPLPSASPAKDDAPRFNPFGNLPVPKSPTKIAASAPPKNILAPKPISNASSTNIFAPKLASDPPKMFPAKPASNATSTNMFAPTTTSTSTDPKLNVIKPPQFGPPKFGSGKVNFMAQFGAKAKESEEENERKLMEKAMMDDLDSDEDEEIVKAWKVDYIKKRKEEREAKKKELEGISKNAKGFVFGDKGKESDSANLPTSESSSESPANAGGAQSTTASRPLFGQPTQSSGNSAFASSSSGSSSEPPVHAGDGQSATTLTSLFGQPTQSSTNSVFGSRTSTPGPFGSSTGSVLDGHTAGQPLLFSGGNIFGHLSDADSGADSGQADEDTASESDVEEDSENRDPNYEPGDESGSGPGTPVEETGAGIASAKKVTSTTPFGSSSWGGGLDVSPLSGTSSPGGSLFGRVNRDPAAGLGGGSVSGTSSPSLFDRITRDSNGHPVRQIPTEDKENTQPSTNTTTNNPFAGLKTPVATTNQTWTPDTPILFGSTTPTPSDTANPAVSVTEATPTKAPASNPFAHLNNSNSIPQSPFSGFGNSVAQAPSVGFNFGSATPLLLPSAAASATTSRATSPGNTTDGASDAEDLDAEKHEQLDLTSGGPGEEDEEIIHEVRAKALQFIPAEGDSPGSWKTKGVGPLRLLKHKETGATRILLRGDPVGNIVLNKSLLAKVNYTADKKTVKLLAAADAGSGLETWILQVKTAEMAEALAEVLESNKPSK